MYQVGDYITVSDNSGLERIRGKTGRITKVLDSGIVAVKLDGGGSATLKFSDIIPVGNMVVFDHPEDSPVTVPTITGYIPSPDTQIVDFVHLGEDPEPSPVLDTVGPGGMQQETNMIDFIDLAPENAGPVAEPDKKGLPWWMIGAGIVAALLFLKK